MKKIISIALLGIFLYNMAGIFVVFKFQQNAIRKEMKKQIKQGVPESELHTITITAENYRDLQWHNEKEFMLNGVMYDVVRKKINSTYSITFQCVNDSQETVLFAQLDEQVGKNMDANHRGKKTVKLLLLTFFLGNSFTEPKPDFETEHTAGSAYAAPFVADLLYAVVVPPPDFI